MRPSRHRSLAVALLALSLSLGAATGARADEASDLVSARTAFNEGTALAQEKRWAEACDRYTASLKLHRAALTLYSLAVAQHEAGRLVAARDSFQAFLVEPVTPSTQPYLEHAREALASLQSRISTLTVTLLPIPITAPEVTIDGETVTGSVSVSLAVDPGPHKITARAPGRAPATASITVPEGRSVPMTLTLTPSADGSEQKPGGVPWPRPLPYALMGTGGAAIGGGVALGLVGLSEAKKAPSGVGPTADGARAKAIGGDVMIGCGIASAGVGLVLFVLQQRHPEPLSTSSAVRVDGSSLSVRF